MFAKILTHIHMVVYTWWCWHICKGDVVGVEIDQLGDEKEELRVHRTLAARRLDSALVSLVANPSLGHSLPKFRTLLS